MVQDRNLRDYLMLELNPTEIRLTRTGWIDQFDEWHSGSSWRGEQCVLDSANHLMKVMLWVTVFGKWEGSARLRPQRWVARLTFGDYGTEVGAGPCKSLTQVTRIVQAIDLTRPAQELLNAFYGPHEASQVFLLSDEGPRPWATTLGDGGDYMAWPPDSEFLVLRQRGLEGKVSSRIVQRTTHGFCSTSNHQSRALAEYLKNSPDTRFPLS